MRRSNGQLDIYIDQKFQAKCNLKIPDGVFGFVFLKGRINKVTIEIGNGIDLNKTLLHIKVRSYTVV